MIKISTENLDEQIAHLISCMDKSIDFLKKLEKTPKDPYQLTLQLAIESEKRVPDREITLKLRDTLEITSLYDYAKNNYAKQLIEKYNHLCKFTADIEVLGKQLSRKIKPIEVL